MKKAITIALFASLLLGMWGCTPTEEGKQEQSKTEQSVSEATVSDSSETESSVTEESADTEKDELQAEIDRLKAELEQQEETNKTLRDELALLKAEDERFANAGMHAVVGQGLDFWFYTDEWISEEQKCIYTLYCRSYGDSEIKKIADLPTHIAEYSFSPDGKTLVFNNYDPDYMSQNYLLNLENGEIKKLNIGDTDEERTVSALRWLNDRYFLFVEQSNAIACQGGDVYVYDTETDEFAKIIGSEGNALEIHSFDVHTHGEDAEVYWLLTAKEWDETYNFTDTYFYAVTETTLYDLIENGKVLTLDPKDGK